MNILWRGVFHDASDGARWNRRLLRVLHEQRSEWTVQIQLEPTPDVAAEVTPSEASLLQHFAQTKLSAEPDVVLITDFVNGLTVDAIKKYPTFFILSRLPNREESQLLVAAHGVFVPSEDFIPSLRLSYTGPITVLGVPAPVIQAAPSLETVWPNVKESRKILYYDRWDRAHGANLVISTFWRWHQKHPDADTALLIITPYSQPPLLDWVARDIERFRQTRQWGAVPPIYTYNWPISEIMEPLYGQSVDGVISLHREPQADVVLQDMARRGIPILAAKKGGLRQLQLDNITYVPAPPHDQGDEWAILDAAFAEWIGRLNQPREYRFAEGIFHADHLLRPLEQMMAASA